MILNLAENDELKKSVKLTWSSAWSKKIMMPQSLTGKWAKLVAQCNDLAGDEWPWTRSILPWITSGHKTLFYGLFIWGNGAYLERLPLSTSTNAPVAVVIFNRLRDCASLSTGTICTSVQCWRNTHLIPHIKLSSIALYWLRTGISCVRYTDVCLMGVFAYTRLVGSYLSFPWVQYGCPLLRVFNRPSI